MGCLLLCSLSMCSSYDFLINQNKNLTRTCILYIHHPFIFNYRFNLNFLFQSLCDGPNFVSKPICWAKFSLDQLDKLLTKPKNPNKDAKAHEPVDTRRPDVDSTLPALATRVFNVAGASIPSVRHSRCCHFASPNTGNSPAHRSRRRHSVGPK